MEEFLLSLNKLHLLFYTFYMRMYVYIHLHEKIVIFTSTPLLFISLNNLGRSTYTERATLFFLMTLWYSTVLLCHT